MMKKLLYTCVLLMVLFAVAGLSWSVGQATAQDGSSRADAPLGSGFTYQGFLHKNGTAVTASCDFQFSLWDQLAGGLQVGAIQQVDGVAVVGGRFTTILNSSNQMIARPFTGKARFLKVAVRCPGDGTAFTALSPRQTLTAAPYAHSLRPGAIINGTSANANEGMLNITGNYDGIRINAADDGIYIDSTGGHAVNIGAPQDNGVNIRQAVNGIEMNQISSNGIYLNGVQENGLHVISAGNNGVQVDAFGNIGIQVKGGVAETALYAASFLGDVDIQGALTCSQANCGIATRAANGSDGLLEIGDVVAIAGVEADSNGEMLIQVRRATAGDTIYGVVSGSAERRDDLLIKTDAPTPAGSLLYVVTEGMAQVDATQLGSAEVGQKVGLSNAGESNTLGIALEAAATRDGLIWVMVDPQ
jgi:hypothetical protein